MINIDDRLFQLVPSVISPTEFYLLLSIAKRIDAKKNSWPSRATLAKELGSSIKSISRMTASLEEKGLITKKQRHIKGKQSSNMYTLNIQGLSVYIPLKDQEMSKDDDDSTAGQNRPTEREIEDSTAGQLQRTPNVPLSIKQSLYSEVLNNNLSLDGGQDFFKLEEEIFNRISASPVYQMNRSKFYPDLTDDDIRGHHRTLCTDPEYLKSQSKYQIFEGKMKAQNGMKLRLTAEEAKRKAEQERIEANKRRQVEYDQILEQRKKQSTEIAAKYSKKEIFKPYWRDYASRYEYENAIQEAREQGKIVETTPLPRNAATAWGENPSYGSVLESLPKMQNTL